MKVKELKEKLASIPDNIDVFVAPRKTEFTYGIVNSVYVKEIEFSEELDEKDLAKEDVLIIDED